MANLDDIRTKARMSKRESVALMKVAQIEPDGPRKNYWYVRANIAYGQAFLLAQIAEAIDTGEQDDRELREAIHMIRSGHEHCRSIPT